METNETKVNSQEFIKTQFDSQFKYQDFCKVRFGERVPYTSTQNVTRRGPQTNNLLEDEIFTEIEILDIVEPENTLPLTSSVAVQTESDDGTVTIGKTQFHNLMKSIENIQKNQQSLMREFVSLRDNRLNVRYLVDCENKKFTLPFNELDLFTKFDTNLTADQESVKQLKSIIMKQDWYDLKKFFRLNFKNIFTDELSRKFTFHGRQRNLSVKRFNVTKILRDCTLEKFPNATQAEFRMISTKCFNYLKDKRNKKTDEG